MLLFVVNKDIAVVVYKAVDVVAHMAVASIVHEAVLLLPVSYLIFLMTYLLLLFTTLTEQLQFLLNVVISILYLCNNCVPVNTRKMNERILALEHQASTTLSV